MQQSINKDDIDNQLETLIMKVFLSKKNSIHRNYFLNAIKDLKPQYCTVKTGWRAGEYISVACKFKKNGEGDVFTEIIKGWENKNDDLQFLYGLYPEIFHFNPQFIFEENEYLHLSFKLLNNRNLPTPANGRQNRLRI